MIGPAKTVPIEEYRQFVGREIGTSPWQVVDQDMVNAFARLTGDSQLIHTDPAVAAMTPYGRTIAHGFLILSLLTAMSYDAVPGIAGAVSGANYGFDRVRFVKPVFTGSQIRGRFTMKEFEETRPGAYRTTLSATVERLNDVSNEAEAAAIAEWLVVSWLR